MARSRSKTATGKKGDSETGVLILSLEEEAQRIAKMFPSAELTREQIADALVFAAVDAGAALQVRAQPRRQVPTIVLPGAFFLLGGKRKRRREAEPPPTFAADPLPATT
jgi:hypothetical protein